MNQAVACSYRHWMLQRRLCFNNLKIILNICDEYLFAWLFYSLNICSVFFKLGTNYPYTIIPTFIIYFLISFWYQILTNIHKIHFQNQSNLLLTRTPPNPFGPRNLSHSSAMSLNFHSSKYTMQLLPGRVLGVFWAWMFATANKRHIRCSSTILQDVVPTHWKCFSIYTARTQGRVNPIIRSYHLFLAALEHHILYWQTYLQHLVTHATYILNTLISPNMNTALRKTFSYS